MKLLKSISNKITKFLNNDQSVHQVSTGLIVVLLAIILVRLTFFLSPFVIDILEVANLALLIILLVIHSKSIKPIMWWIASAVIVGLGLIPGFPLFLLLPFALITTLIGCALWLHNGKRV